MKIGKLVDSLAIKVITFTFLFIWLNFFIKNIWISVIVSLLLTLAIFIILSTIFKNKKVNFVNIYDYFNTIIILGNENAVNLYKKMYPHDTRYIRAILRFSPLSNDDITSIYRDRNINAVIICFDVKRSVKVYASTLNLNVEFITLKRFVKLLKSNNLLPKKIDATPKINISFEEFFDGIFSKDNAKFYLFSGIILAIFSLVTPYKIYYIILASVNLIFAFVSKIAN